MFAPDIMTLLYSEKYLPGVSVFRVYNMVLLLRCTYFGMILNAKGKTKFIFYSSLISLGLNVLLNYVLFQTMGLIGPPIATFISQLIINTVQLAFPSYTINVSFLGIFPWKGLASITVLNFIMGLAFFYTKALISLDVAVGSLSESLILGALWSILYLAILFPSMKKQ